MSGDEHSPGLISSTTIFLRYDADGTFRGIVGTYPGAERWMRVGKGAIEIRTFLFGRTPRLAMTGNRWFCGPVDRYEMAEHARDGTTRWLVRREHETENITDSDVDARIEKRLEDVDSAPERAEARRRYRDLPTQETFPTYDELAVYRDGHLWVEGYRMPGSEAPPWSVFAPDGRWLGDVSLPDGFVPMWIDDEVVAGVREDELDVEHVRAYRIGKS